jgi:hypothetical protein
MRQAPRLRRAMYMVLLGSLLGQSQPNVGTAAGGMVPPLNQFSSGEAASSMAKTGTGQTTLAVNASGTIRAVATLPASAPGAGRARNCPPLRKLGSSGFDSGLAEAAKQRFRRHGKPARKVTSTSSGSEHVSPQAGLTWRIVPAPDPQQLLGSAEARRNGRPSWSSVRWVQERPLPGGALRSRPGHEMAVLEGLPPEAAGLNRAGAKGVRKRAPKKLAQAGPKAS